MSVRERENSNGGESVGPNGPDVTNLLRAESRLSPADERRATRPHAQSRRNADPNADPAISSDAGLGARNRSDLQAESRSEAGYDRPVGETRTPRRSGLIVGESPALSSIRDIASSIASRRCTVLLLGETGTGKEMLARHIHAESDRASKPFVVVDCSAMTDTLFESQLFGHVKGAFTGAARDSVGFIRSADTGTLFLDEIGELSISLQAKLLRVIQDKAVVPVGDTRPRPVDIRIVCATHRDLRQMVSEQLFREDLFFRLNVVTLHLPPLRERPGDIIPLARHFLDMQAELYDEPTRKLSPKTIEILRNYSWPGNVRELANAIEHAHVLSTSDSIEPENLPERVRGGGAKHEAFSELCLIDLERRAITEALRRSAFNKAAAARMLGINIQRLGRRMAKLKVKLPHE
jgi:transcriptional regulator with PAS, ATPase and Fis domain